MLSSRFIVVQVVRRFGEVGGMEGYVWRLSHALIKLQVSVIVICEEILQSHDPNLQVIRLQKAWSRPRWLALCSFGFRAKKAVSALVIERSSQRLIVHSHERCGFHHVTTFHGPPFARIRERPFWYKVSVRVFAHLWLERRELLTSSVRAVVPNSRLIARSLSNYYPSVRSRLKTAITPGVPRFNQRSTRDISSTGGTITFIGREWKRKGLEFFLIVIKELAKIRPDLEVIILGPAESEIRPLIADCAVKLRALGWQPSSSIFHETDLLIHPASSEPYGMVVAEAMAAGVPVVVSDDCGVACDVTPLRGTVLSLSNAPRDWALTADTWLGQKNFQATYTRDWEDVAREYLNIYQSLEKGLYSRDLI